jgi:nucleoid-associated protein YgaU
MSLAIAVIALLPRMQSVVPPSGDAANLNPAKTPKPSQPPANTTDGGAIETATKAVEALATTLAPAGVKPNDGSGGGPAFDVARIGPAGDAVIAGRAAPGASVELLRDGVVLDKAVANQSGEFVIIPNTLPPGDYSLTLRATRPDGTVLMSKGSVAVALQSTQTGTPVAALPAPKTEVPAPKSPADDQPPSAAPAPANGDVRIIGIESTGSGKLLVSGQSEPGATVKLYLNGSYIASGVASASGQVAFAIGSGVIPGDYRVRLDLVDGAARVRAYAEQVFSARAVNALPSLAAATPSTPDAPRRAGDAELVKVTPTPALPATTNNAGQSAGSQIRPEPLISDPKFAAPSMESVHTSPPSEQLSKDGGRQVPVPETRPQSSAVQIDAKNVVVIPGIETTTVRRGDNLWDISRSTYGEGVQYPKIYDANRNQIRDPDLIFPGQIFVLPRGER